MKNKSILYNIISCLLLQIIVFFNGFIVLKLIISNYGSDVNGLVYSISQFLTYIVFFEAGFSLVVKSTLYKPISKKDNKTINEILKSSNSFYKKLALIFLVYVLLLMFLYPLLTNKSYDFLYTSLLIFIIGISTFFEYYFGTSYSLFLQAKQKTYVVSIIQIISYIINLIIVILLIKLGVNIHYVKLATAIIFTLRSLFLYNYVKKKYNIYENVEKYKLKQKKDAFAQHIAYVIHTHIDVTLITLFLSFKDVSIYGMYLMIVNTIKSISQSFSSGIDAYFGNMIANKEEIKLKKYFGLYEFVYFTIVTIIFSCTLILITPFISIYTSNIVDVDYTKYIFGYLMVISEFIFIVRVPYNELIKCAGHFKETKKGAIIECIINFIISLSLIIYLGIEGVIVGTIVAIFIRMIELIIYSNKYILKRRVFESIKKIILIIIETIIIFVIFRFIIIDPKTYLEWIKDSIIVLLISSLIIIITNIIFMNKEFKKIKNIIRKN